MVDEIERLRRRMEAAASLDFKEARRWGDGSTSCDGTSPDEIAGRAA